MAGEKREKVVDPDGILYDSRPPKGKPFVATVLDPKTKRYKEVSICGAKAKSRVLPDGRPCRCEKTPSENGRCNETHSGSGTMSGTPIKTGLTSKFYVPRKFQEAHAELLKDAALAGVRNEIALDRARMSAIREEAEELEELGQMELATAKWAEHDRLKEELRKLAKDETRREAIQAETLSAREVTAMRAAMFTAVDEVVSELIGVIREVALEAERRCPELGAIPVRDSRLKALIWERFASRLPREDPRALALDA